MAETALQPYVYQEVKIDLTKADRKAVKAYASLQRQQYAIELTRLAAKTLTDLIKNPSIGITAAWLFIEQANNKQWFGYDRAGSDYSASILQYGLLAAYASSSGIFDSIKNILTR